MACYSIDRITVSDLRYPLPAGAGSDAVHTEPEYCLAVTQLISVGGNICGTGFALTLGEGNRLVCEAIEILARSLRGRPIDELMADFGRTVRQLANDPVLRWLGPHKGVVHLALASITNACFDLWAKSRGVPLWRLLLDLEPKQLVALLDLSYLDELLDENAAMELLRQEAPARTERSAILREGYPGYDTSVGWMAYDDDKVSRADAAGNRQGLQRIQAEGGLGGSQPRPAPRRHAARVRRRARRHHVRRQPAVDIAYRARNVSRALEPEPAVDRGAYPSR